MQRLNLGCGKFLKDGFINVDWDPASGAEVIHDLNDVPYPFSDAQFEEIEASHVLEHLSSPFRAMAELNRILKPGGIITIRVPHFSRGFTHPEHMRGFGSTFPLYFNPGFQGGYTGVHLDLNRMRMHWSAQPYLIKTLMSPIAYAVVRVLGKLIDSLANLSPDACSRIWCYWVGGFEEMEFVFRKPR